MRVRDRRTSVAPLFHRQRRRYIYPHHVAASSAVDRLSFARGTKKERDVYVRVETEEEFGKREARSRVKRDAVESHAWRFEAGWRGVGRVTRSHGA